MAIPVSTIVDVGITVGATFPARKGFGILNIVALAAGAPYTSVERIRSYANIDGVVGDWGASHEVSIAATSYFGQQPKPTQLKVSVRDEFVPAGYAVNQLVGAPLINPDVADFQVVSDQRMRPTIDGTQVSLSEGSFNPLSGAVTLEDVAQIVEDGLQSVGQWVGSTVEWVAAESRFVLTSSVAIDPTLEVDDLGPPSGTSFGDLLNLRFVDGAALGTGIPASGETILESLSAISEVDDDWYGLMYTREVRDALITDAITDTAAWAEARIKIFFNTTNDANTLVPGSTTDIADILSLMSLRRTITTYSSTPEQYPSASVAGRAFTVNFNQPNSTLTLKFKQLPAITVEQISVNQKAALDGKNANAYVDVGGSFMYAESFMGNGTFFDEVHGLDWLQNAVQINVFGYLLTRPTKVPYTNKGVAAIEQQVIRALDEAVLNGLIAPGETIDGEFLPLGYKTVTIPVEDINQSAVDARNYPGLSFTVLGAGAIHGVQINGIFER